MMKFILCLFVLLLIKESHADFWCKDSAYKDLIKCIHPRCKNAINQTIEFYCRLRCANETGNCVPTLPQTMNSDVIIARKYFKCMKKCTENEGSPQIQCWKSCDKQSAPWYPG